ncbi:MAG: twin-arginine translocation signal domain-containing protein [Bacteroidetes bacterium]|nr:MAG: twin-arginine translocation signal domain-containing protein [Bacteroidota bacterium]
MKEYDEPQEEQHRQDKKQTRRKFLRDVGIIAGGGVFLQSHGWKQNRNKENGYSEKGCLV